MFCPKCGKGENAPNSYCRNCGEWLVDTSALSRRGGFMRGGYSKSAPEKRLRVISMLSLLSAIFAAVVLINLIRAFSRIETPPAVGLAFGFLAAIMGWQIVCSVISFGLRREMLNRRRVQSNKHELNSAHTTHDALPVADTAQFVRPPASVTENSTELLEPVLRKSNQ